MEESTEIPDLDDAAVIFVENEDKCLSVRGEALKMHPRTSNVFDTCPVCHSHFHSRDPKLLPCLHSFCMTCLPSPSRNLAMPDPTANSQFDRATKPLNVIRCPVCRQECMEVDVMENFFVKDSGEIPSTVQRTAQICMSCEDNTEASGFCVDCVEFLCFTCVEAHQRVKFTKDHTIRQKEEVAEEARGVSNQRPAFCDVHKQEPLKLFCETCDLLTCRDCQLLKHKDHNYQFLEDAYKNLKRHMETVTNQLQEKKKVVDEMSSSIDKGLSQVDENRTLVNNEIKKAICSLILEINRKGKILVNQLEALTKDSETVLKKQKEDIGYLSRHLDHILFQIGNLLRAKCNTSFAPQSSLRFQCRSAFWASNVDLGSLVVENLPSHSLGGGYQGLHQQLPLPRQGPQGSPSGPPPGPPQAHPAPHSTLAQLQLQVEKLAQQPHWQPPPPPWSWYQSMGLQKPAQGPLHVGSPSQTGLPVPQPGRRFMPPPSNHLSPTGSLPSPGFAPQAVLPLRGMTGPSGFQPPDHFQLSPLHSHSAPLLSNSSFSSPHSHLQMESLYLSQRSDGVGPVQIRRPSFSQTLPPFLPHRNAEGLQSSQGLSAVSREEKPGTVSWRQAETQPSPAQTSAPKRRRRMSPGPIIVIKDEPEEDMSYMQANQKANLPDSTGVQAPPHIQTHPHPPHHAGEHIQTHPHPPHLAGEHIQTHPHPPHHAGEHIQTHPHPPHHAGEHIQTHPHPPHHAGEHIQTHPHPPHHAGEHIQTHPHPPHHAGEHIQTHPHPPHHAGEHIQTHPHPPHHAGEHIQTHPHPPHLAGEHIQTHPHPPHHAGEHIQTHPHPPHHAGEHIQTHPHPPHHAGEHIQTHPSLDDQVKTPPQPPETGGGLAQPDGPQHTAVPPDLAPEKDPSRDRCAVCQTEGKLRSCNKCPKVFHLTCHIPTLPRSPSAEWLCTFCREPSLPEMEDVCVRRPEPVKEEPLSEPRLSPVNRRKCECLLLRLYCSELSAALQETPLVTPEDTGALKAHMNLATVKNRLESPSSPYYHSPAEFVSDIRLIFRNPAANQEPGSKVAAAARKLEQLFEEQLKVVFPDRTFPEVKTEVTGPVTPPVSPPSTPGLAPAAAPLSRCSEPRGAASPISTPREEREAA